MPVIIIIPFPVTRDTLTVNYNAYKVYKTNMELEEAIKNAEENEVILTYVVTNRIENVFISDLYGNIRPVNYLNINSDDLKYQVKEFNTSNYPSISDIPVVNTENSTEVEKIVFDRDLRFQLRSEYFNYHFNKYVLKMGEPFFLPKDGSKLTCLDLIEKLIFVKFKFLGHIKVVVHHNPYINAYEHFFRFVHTNVCFPEDLYYVYKDGKNFSEIKQYLMSIIVVKDNDEEVLQLPIECELKDSGIDRFTFITENGFTINISSSGSVTIDRMDSILDSSMYLV